MVQVLSRTHQAGMLQKESMSQLTELIRDVIQRTAFVLSVLHEFEMCMPESPRYVLHADSETAQQPKEFILLAEVSACAQAIRRVLLYLCSTTFPSSVSVDQLMLSDSGWEDSAQVCVTCHDFVRLGLTGSRAT